MIIVQGTKNTEAKCPPCKPSRKKSRKRTKQIKKRLEGVDLYLRVTIH